MASSSDSQSVSSKAHTNSGCIALPSAFFLMLKATEWRSGFCNIICAMSNNGYARPVILIWRASDSTPFSSGSKLTSISGRGGGGSRRSGRSPRRKGGLPSPETPRPPSARGASPRSPGARLFSRRRSGDASLRGRRGPRRSSRRSSLCSPPSYLAYFAEAGSCAQAGKKSFSRSNSFSGAVFITLGMAQAMGAPKLPLNQHGTADARLQAPAGICKAAALSCYSMNASILPGNLTIRPFLLASLLCGLAQFQTLAAERASVLFNGNDLTGWCKPTADWTVAQAVAVDPANPEKFLITPGKGVLVNGTNGPTAYLLTEQ